MDNIEVIQGMDLEVRTVIQVVDIDAFLLESTAKKSPRSKALTVAETLIEEKILERGQTPVYDWNDRREIEEKLSGKFPGERHRPLIFTQP